MVQYCFLGRPMESHNPLHNSFHNSLHNPVQKMLEPFRDRTGGVITALRAIVAESGFISADDQKAVAEVFNLSAAEVRGIVSFYEDLKTSPPATRTIRLCQAEACQANGCRGVTSALEAQLGINLGEATADGSVALEAVYCLGYCAAGPTAQVDGQLHTHIHPEEVTALLQEVPRSVSSSSEKEEEKEESAHPNYEGQTRLVFKRVGFTDPLSLVDYRTHGGFAALATEPKDILAQVKASGLRGRGGAGFPAHIKWQTVADQVADDKYIVCNADEGDSGTFADRLIMERDPFLLIDGMLLAGRAVGARKGYIYLRSEYPEAAVVVENALAIANAAGVLGEHFRIELFIGAGAYICGEETALLESLEGKKGVVRTKPPIPAISGLFGKPTLVHNVITLCSVPWIVDNGGDAYARFGVGASTGTLPFQLAGNVKRGGLYEIPFGMPVSDFIDKFGGGTRSGRPIKAVQIGGPLGAYLPVSLLDTPLTYEAMAAIGAGIGHGGIVVFDDTVELAEQAQYAFEFCAHESCGKCTPCRIGSVRGVELIEDIRRNGVDENKLIVLKDLCDTLTDASLCAMGGMTPIPVESALKHFPEDFGVDT